MRGVGLVDGKLTDRIPVYRWVIVYYMGDTGQLHKYFGSRFMAARCFPRDQGKDMFAMP